jgi:uncharacterized protein (TIGR02391 family)
VRERIVALLAGQGWHVTSGRLVIGDRGTAQEATAPAGGSNLRVKDLHSEVRSVAEAYLKAGHPEAAVFEVFKAISIRVKKMTGLPEDGTTLMSRALSDKNPRLVLADLNTETGRNIQTGYRFLFMGAVQGIRNPGAHEPFTSVNEHEALEKLAFASMLMRRLDDATAVD